jgi:predicted nucleic acid-binding protein
VGSRRGRLSSGALAERAIAAPDLLLSECANSLWRWVRTGALGAQVAHERFAALRGAPVALTPAEVLLERALRLAIAIDHPIYDCLYLALALACGVPVVSADRRFVTAVRRQAGLSGSIILLAETAH